MSNELDAILQQMSELTQAVKSGQSDPALLNWDMLEPTFKAQLEEMVDAQVAKRVADQPVRRGDAVDPGAVDKSIATLSNNRYTRVVKDILHNGKSPGFMGSNVKAIDLYMAERAMSKGHAIYPDRYQSPSDELKAAVKALSSTGSGTGDELVPTNMAAELWEDVHLANVLVSNLDPFPMTSNPMDLPNALGDVTFYKGSENVATTASDPATAKNTLTVTEHVGEVDWSYSLEEDAVVALMPAVRRTVARNAAEFMDGFALNADSSATATGNINSSSAAPSADSYYLSAGQDGIRHLYLVDNTSQATNAATGALTDAHITSTLVKMKKYAADPRQLLCVCDVSTYLRGFLNATTSNSPGTFIKSINDVGYSIIVTGQVAMYRGFPIVIPTKANLTNHGGKIGTTTATFGQVSFINRTQWKSAFMRDLMVEVDRDIQKRQIIMVISYRQAVGCRGTRSSATHTAGINNISVS